MYSQKCKDAHIFDKGKSPEVPFHGITLPSSYSKFLRQFSNKQNIQKNYQLSRNKKFVDKAPNNVLPFYTSSHNPNLLYSEVDFLKHSQSEPPLINKYLSWKDLSITNSQSWNFFHLIFIHKYFESCKIPEMDIWIPMHFLHTFCTVLTPSIIDLLEAKEHP